MHIYVYMKMNMNMSYNNIRTTIIKIAFCMMAEILTAIHYHILMRVWNFKHLQYERAVFIGKSNSIVISSSMHNGWRVETGI